MTVNQRAVCPSAASSPCRLGVPPVQADAPHSVSLAQPAPRSGSYCPCTCVPPVPRHHGWGLVRQAAHAQHALQF